MLWFSVVISILAEVDFKASCLSEHILEIKATQRRTKRYGAPPTYPLLLFHVPFIFADIFAFIKRSISSQFWDEEGSSESFRWREKMPAHGGNIHRNLLTIVLRPSPLFAWCKRDSCTFYSFFYCALSFYS